MYLCPSMPIDFFKHIIQFGKSGEWIRRIIPSDNVGACIEGFYLFSGTETGSESLLFADGVPMMAIMPRETDTVRIVSQSAEVVAESAWISGGIIRNAYISGIESIDYLLIVRFNPVLFYKMFNLPSDLFRNKGVGRVKDLLGENGQQMLDSVFSVSSLPRRIDKIESFVKEISSGLPYLGLLNEAISYIHNEKGIIPIQRLADKLGVNYKWLERNFQSGIGITPKEYARLQRFINAYVDLVNDNERDKLDIALSNGYYDYNHLKKDFKLFTGESPATYLRTRICKTDHFS